MKLLKFDFLERHFKISNHDIFSIILEDIFQFRKIYYSLHNNENIMNYTIDYEQKDPYKHASILFSPFEINFNNKKILNLLYKTVINKINQNQKDQINFINTCIINLLDEISLDIPLVTNFNLEIDFIKVLSLYDFTLRQSEANNLLEIFLEYIKLFIELQKIDFIILIDLLKFFTQEEYNALQEEIKLLQISIINIELSKKNRKRIQECILMDEDYCEI